MILFPIVTAQCDLHVSMQGNDTTTCGSEDSPCATIQQAVWNANENDTICVWPGEPYHCPSSGEGVYINKSLTISSYNGTEVNVSTVIDYRRQGRAFLFDNAGQCSLFGFEIANGRSNTSGGAIYAMGTAISIEQCVF